MQRFIIYQATGEHHAPDAGKWFLYDTLGKPDNDRGPYDSLDVAIEARRHILAMEKAA